MTYKSEGGDMSKSVDTKGLTPQVVTKVHENPDIYMPDPETLSDEDLIGELEINASRLANVSGVSAVIRYHIGKLIEEIHKREHLWRSYGSFDTYLKDYASKKLGLARSTIYEARRVALRWPSLSETEVSEIGLSKLSVLSQIADQSQPGHGKLLEKARNMNYEEFKEWVNSQLHVDVTETYKVIRVPKSIHEEWRALIHDPRVHVRVGSESPIAIFAAMLAEVRSSWGI